MPHFCNDCHRKVQPNQPACKCGGKQAYAADNPAKEIDVFSYLEQVIIKKDLDNFDWFYSGYSPKEQKKIKKMLDKNPDEEIEVNRDCGFMLGLTSALQHDIIEWITTGERVKRDVAVRELEKFKAYLRDECKTEGKNPRARHFDEAHEGSAGRVRHAARTKSYHPVAGHYRRYPKE